MKKCILPLLLIMSVFSFAQETWSITFRPSLHFPTRKVFNTPLRLGNGADLTAEYALNKQAKIYAGFTHNLFDSDEDFDEENIEIKHSGIVMGGMYFFSLLPEQKSPFYLRAGITYTFIESKSNDTIFHIETDWSIGTQLGIGWKVEPAENWFFLPELRYSSFSNAYQMDGAQRYINLTHVSISIGLMHAF